MNADTGLEQRLNFIGINAHSQARLRELKPLLEKVMGPALDVFYERVQSTPQTRVFFPTPAIIAHAKEKQSAHWRVITDAQYGADYATNVRAIGQAHARFGLEPRWYIGGYAIVIEQLIQAIVNTRWPRLLSGGQKAATEVAESLSALVKASLLDMDLAISIYLESLEARRQEEEVKRLKAQQEQTAALTALAVALDRLAKGDLTVKFDAAVAPDFDKLKDDVNNTVARLAKAMLSVAQAADAINNGAAEITVAADEMASRGERQAASLEQSTAAINLLSASVGEAAKAARQVAETASTTRKNVEHSSSVVDETVAAMAAIEASSRQIAQTVGIIDEIAFQTNLLALNAGVEAARAGEAGRGFAVVASEVRGLAQRSAEAAKEIKSIINESTNQIDQGVHLVRETGEALKTTIEQIIHIDELVSGIASATAEQSSGLAEIDTAISQIDKATQHNASMMEQTTAATHSLRAEAAQLVALVDGFEMEARHTHRSAPPPPAPRSAARAVAAAGRRPKLAVANSGAGEWQEF